MTWIKHTNRPINYNGRYTLPRDERGNLIIPTGEEKVKKVKPAQVKPAQVSLPPPLDEALPEEPKAIQIPKWRYPPNFANWLGGWLSVMKIADPAQWVSARLGEPEVTKPYHVQAWLNGFTLPSPWRFLNLCKIIAVMNKQSLSDVIQEAAQACFRSTGRGYKTSIGFEDDSLIDLS